MNFLKKISIKYFFLDFLIFKLSAVNLLIKNMVLKRVLRLVPEFQSHNIK